MSSLGLGAPNRPRRARRLSRTDHKDRSLQGFGKSKDRTCMSWAEVNPLLLKNLVNETPAVEAVNEKKQQVYPVICIGRSQSESGRSTMREAVDSQLARIRHISQDRRGRFEGLAAENIMYPAKRYAKRGTFLNWTNTEANPVESTQKAGNSLTSMDNETKSDENSQNTIHVLPVTNTDQKPEENTGKTDIALGKQRCWSKHQQKTEENSFFYTNDAGVILVNRSNIRKQGMAKGENMMQKTQNNFNVSNKRIFPTAENDLLL